MCVFQVLDDAVAEVGSPAASSAAAPGTGPLPSAAAPGAAASGSKTTKEACHQKPCL